MKSLGVIFSFFAASWQRRNLRVLLWLVLIFATLVTIFSSVFHLLMEHEGQRHSWATGFYWTLVTMTTLGFGDITFHSDAGRIFSIFVLLSGSVFLLALLPFTFLQFVFTPWIKMREAARAPRQLPATMSGHLILTSLGAIEEALIQHAEHANVPYVVLSGELDRTLELHDRGYSVMFGAIDHPDTYRAARVADAALVAATQSDMTNTNITFTVREQSATVPIVTTAARATAIDNLRLAGADEVLLLGDMLGNAMAQRALAPGHSHEIGTYADLVIAEGIAAGTDLVGYSLAELRLRAHSGVGVLGVFRRGAFEVATASTEIGASDVLLLAGTPEQLRLYDELHSPADPPNTSTIIIGAGRVGRAAAKRLADVGAPYRIVEQREDRIRSSPTNRNGVYIHGDAADIEVLQAAGITRASTVLITTHDDDVNIYLSIYCRHLRSDVRIVSRANRERNVTTLYRAGADAVLSYASTGATAIWNHIRPDELIVIAEGLSLFRRQIPRELVGKQLGETHIRRDTGCNVVAIEADGVIVGNPDKEVRLPSGGSLLLIGNDEADDRFTARYSRKRRRHLRHDQTNDT